jgi:hypothetical protein
MKKFKDVEKTRIQAHKDPARDSVHRASLLVPELPGAVAEISFVNHFLLKRGYPHVACRITAIDAEGQRIESRLHPIQEPRVYRFRLTGSVDAPVATYMVEFFTADNLFIPFPAVMVNHHGPGFYNTVHAFNRVLNDVFENDAINAQPVAEASIDVDLSGGRDTFAVFTAGPTACRGKLTLDLATPQRTYHAALTVDRPRMTQHVVSVRETFPDVDGATSGVLRIRQPEQFLFYGRMLAGIREADGAFSANHSYYDCSGISEYWEDRRGSYRSYPHFASFDSAIRMYPVQSPGALEIAVGLHGADGKELARTAAGCVASPGTRVLEADVATLARGAGIDPKDVRTFVVYADAPEGAVPCRANHQLAYSSGGLSSSINVSLFNPNVYTPQRPGLTWAQSIVGDGVDSRFAIVGNTPAADDCDVEMSFYDESGHVADLQRRLPAGGAVEVDPARDLGLSGGSARPVWVIARCPRPDVSLFEVTRDRSTGHCSGEHGF